MKSWKKLPTKVAKKHSNWFFSLLPWAAPTTQIKEFMFQNRAYRPTVYKTGMQILPIMQPWIFFFRVFLNSNHKISRHKSSRKFLPHLTVVLIEFRSEIYDLKNTLRRRDTNQRPSTTNVQFSTMLPHNGLKIILKERY